MTQETYENLMRVILKRKRQALISGNRAAFVEACEAQQKLETAFNQQQP